MKASKHQHRAVRAGGGASEADSTRLDSTRGLEDDVWGGLRDLRCWARLGWGCRCIWLIMLGLNAFSSHPSAVADLVGECRPVGMLARLLAGAGRYSAWDLVAFWLRHVRVFQAVCSLDLHCIWVELTASRRGVAVVPPLRLLPIEGISEEFVIH